MGLTAFSNADLNRALYLVKFSEKIPGRFVENQHNALFSAAYSHNYSLITSQVTSSKSVDSLTCESASGMIKDLPDCSAVVTRF